MNRIFTLTAAVMLTAALFAQSPEKMSYQAVIRYSNNSPVANANLGMQISILQDSASGTAVYVETQTPATNASGLVTIEIGNGTVLSGDFTAIEWENGPYFIRTETDPTGGTNYTIRGTSQLLSVPYALHAKTSGSVTGAITETDPVFGTWDKSTGITIAESQVSDLGPYIENETDPVYGASVAGGITAIDTAGWNHKLDSYTETDPVFGTWDKSTGITIAESQVSDLGPYIENETDPVYGASVAGGITATDTAGWNHKLDSYTETDPKILSDSLNMVPRWNGSAYVDGIIYDNGSKIGIGTITPAYKLEVSEDASFHGVRVGRGAGNETTNTVLGHLALDSNTGAGVNTAVGHSSLKSLQSGGANTAVGAGAMTSLTDGMFNTATGTDAMRNLGAGSYNTSCGRNALHNNVNGSYNIAIGAQSLGTNLGNNNTALGTGAGFNNQNGSGNVFIGFEAGYNEAGSHKLYIANSAGTPLIYGDFSTSRMGIGTITPAKTLDVNGDLNFSGTLYQSGNPVVTDGSDTRLTAGSNIVVTGNGTPATPYSVSLAQPEFYLGQDTLGGIVFYIWSDENGDRHGLIVSKTEATAKLQNADASTNADRSWDGAYNTGLITDSPAKDWITSNFGTEWYLPSIDEISLLWHARFHVNKALHNGGFTQLSKIGWYWSSTEYNSGIGWFYDFTFGHTGYYDKKTVQAVRAVRVF
ncbi:MAG: DUF1566 domain-containing protein [Bacteroidales bacterium]|nr:DUF1566 domain-containing protein [Bacteroidales bacterium]